ncbi:MAG: lipid-A-disaccharide synthase [Desulfohalobium sp.]
MTDTPTLWISAVETSADMHGARVMQRLRKRHPEIAFQGVGGPAMRAAGLKAVARAEDLSVMGITEVLEFLPRILSILRRVKKTIRTTRPRAVLCIDAPDFHFPVAKHAARQGIPVVYYVAPQAWAWRQGRVRFLRRYVHQLLCLLPFEEDFFRKHGVNAHFTGHPLLEEMAEHNAGIQPQEPSTLALLPGSRRKEIQALLPAFRETAHQLHRNHPGLRCRLIQAPGIGAEELTAQWPPELPLELVPAKNRWPALASSTVALAASGTATLECALLGVPTMVAYSVSPLSYAVGKRLVRVPYISLPNLILNSPLFPELLQEQACPERMLPQIDSWLRSPEQRTAIRDQLEGLRDKLGTTAASLEVARAVEEAAGLGGGASKGA